MQFHYIGMNYKNAGLAIRDKISFTDQKKMEFFAQMEMLGVRQCLILSTCNRSEVFYLDEDESQDMRQKDTQNTDTQETGTQNMDAQNTDTQETGTQNTDTQNTDIQQSSAQQKSCKQALNPERIAGIKKIYTSMFPEVNLAHSLDEIHGEDALLYFFRIAAGLESQVIGEDQILGQVREAWEFSRAQGHTGKEMNRIAQDAIAEAKRIKSEYHISEQPLSIAYIGIQHLNTICPIRGQKALVIGSGQTAALAVRYLYDYGAEEICVCSRNFTHAKKLQEEFSKICVIPYEERYQVLTECSIVVSATSAPHLVLRREELEKLMLSDGSQKMYPDAELLSKETLDANAYTNEADMDYYESVHSTRVYLDLAAPRDIDPEIGTLPDIERIDLDILKQASNQNRRKREQLCEACQDELLAAVRETEVWLTSSRVDQTLATLQEKCDEIVEDSFAYLNRKMVLEPREQKILKRTLRASLNRLLREPIQELKQSDSTQQETYEQALRGLFHMDTGGSSLK